MMLAAMPADTLFSLAAKRLFDVLTVENQLLCSKFSATFSLLYFKFWTNNNHCHPSKFVQKYFALIYVVPKYDM
jgi:hypothetical protein